MNDLLKGRKFQFWEYLVSQGSLLIRSPFGKIHKTNIDIMFAGVKYIDTLIFPGEITVM